MHSVNPDYYVKGRRFQPIHVIEDWSLCHHLACVVKYVCRAGRKGEMLLDLQKAEWYLQRELNIHDSCTKRAFVRAFLPFEEVIADWQVSAHLAETLMAVKYAFAPGFTKQFLEKALYHLHAEIATHTKGESR